MPIYTFYLKFIFIPVLCMLALYTSAQEIEFKAEMLVRNGDTLRYRIAYPDNYSPQKQYPVLVFLHGSGQRGSDNQAQLVGVPKPLLTTEGRLNYPCFILVPQCPKNDVWVKFPTFPKSIAATSKATTSMDLVLSLVKRYSRSASVDPKRVYLTGYSMGGEGVFDALSRRSSLFAAAVPICAVADTAKTRVYKEVPIWAFHGELDDVNPVVYSRMIIESLEKQGGKPKYTEYPATKHNSWTKAYSEPQLFEWLFAQRR